MALLALSSLALIFYTVAGGIALQLLRPGVGLGADIPWGRLIAYTGMSYLGSWLILSIQTWISLRWKSFVIACGAGIALTVAGFFIVNASWGSYWPWALPGAIANEFNESVLHIPELIFGTLGGLVMAFLGGWDVTRQDIL
jgi:hypothetical protein